MADYLKKLREMRETIEQSDSGMMRSDETKVRLKNLDERIRKSESAGAGRGGQGGPTAKEADLNRAMMSPAERAARDEMQEQKEIRKNQEAYNKSLTNLKKGGYVKAADGIAKRGKTRGVMVACGGGYMKKGK